MASSKVANRYSKSFLDTSIEKNILDKVSSDFDLVYRSLIKSPELLRAFKSPVIKTETKQSILAEIFGKLIDNTVIHQFVDGIISPFCNQIGHIGRQL